MYCIYRVLQRTYIPIQLKNISFFKVLERPFITENGQMGWNVDMAFLMILLWGKNLWGCGIMIWKMGQDVLSHWMEYITKALFHIQSMYLRTGKSWILNCRKQYYKLNYYYNFFTEWLVKVLWCLRMKLFTKATLLVCTLYPNWDLLSTNKKKFSK